VDFEKAYNSVDWGFLEYMMRRLGFGNKWVTWMKACVFGGSMSILVNGSPTEEIQIKRGLKQGDPLAPFLFLIVAEGFSGLMRNAVRLNLFEGFRFKEDGMVISHLQYADDTICIRKATVGNLWFLKALLKGFELASGLKVNFSKSCLIGINIQREFMEMACRFLGCSESNLPFKYLGLPVGANHKSLSTWEPLFEHLTKRLNSWSNRFVSFGGRIVLLNSVLNVIPIFYLSFMKMSVKVWRKLVRIQREFLWGGVEGGRKFCWVKWSKVCQPKARGGLGIRDVKLVNLSLLAKWIWRLLQGGGALWKEVLQEKYGMRIGDIISVGNDNWRHYVSRWWKDIATLDEHEGISSFNDEVTRKVCDGENTLFWRTRWRGREGGVSFCDKYPRLFAISNQKDASIATMGEVGEDGFGWRRRLFVWEEDLLGDLVRDIQGFVKIQEEDRWDWELEENGSYSVKSMFKKLEERVGIGLEWGEPERKVFEQVWKSSAPSKVVALSWKLLLNRIPTRLNFVHRNVLPPNANLCCVFCNEENESTNHLFIHCRVSWCIWLNLQYWLEMAFPTPNDLFNLWRCWNDMLPQRKYLKKGLKIIWHTAIWVMWKARNNVIFNNYDLSVDHMVEEIKVVSWRWTLSRLKIPSCLFYKWCWNPRYCLGR